VDRYRVNANPDQDPTFCFNVTPDSDLDFKLENQNFLIFLFAAMPVYIVC
jgi:hypothetical protein